MSEVVLINLTGADQPGILYRGACQRDDALSAQLTGGKECAHRRHIHARLGEQDFERVFASGGGAPAVLGRDAAGGLIVQFSLAPR